MAILTSDIKLLKSAVMADTTDGGGPLTGVVVVDGQSNNVYPDTSEIDRAYGRIQLRKLFGVASTDNTDTLLGSHAIITHAPDDPLVAVSMFQTPSWGDTRNTAKEIIQRYLVKGPRYACRLLDNHYAGTQIISLVGVSDSDFPAPGDAVVFRKPDLTEQYVRVTKSTLNDQSFNVLGVGTATVRKCVIELSQPLEADQPGQPISQVEDPNPSTYTFLYTTSPAVGAKFYGIAPLTTAAAVGDSNALLPSIFVPVVPASTIETPIVDQFPLTLRASLSRTAYAALTYSETGQTVAPGSVVELPTSVAPGTLTITGGGIAMVDDGNGTLKVGAVEVATVDYKAGKVTMGTASSAYASSSTSYEPASLGSAACYSASRDITTGNQGISFVEAFEPPPAPTTLSLSYMAQGRWYELRDNGNGKIAGTDAAYGVGTINYTTGSMTITLGAVPDVGSPLVYTWGDTYSAVAASTVGTLPTRLGADIALPANFKPNSVTLSWSRGATNYTAAMSAVGILSGNATGKATDGVLVFEPGVLPSGNVTLAYKVLPAPGTPNYTGSGTSITLTNAPVEPGSIMIRVALEQPLDAGGFPSSAYLKDDGAGNMVRKSDGVICGAVNYATGVCTLPSLVLVTGSPYKTTSGDWTYAFTYWVRTPQNQNITAILDVVYAGANAGTTSSQVLTVSTLVWKARLPIYTGSTSVLANTVLQLDGTTYYSSAGTGTNLIKLGNKAVSGSVALNGEVTVLAAALPAAGNNVITWINAAVDASLRRVAGGVFRTASAPLKSGVMQIQSGGRVGSANSGGVISGGLFTGTTDFSRGVVRWGVTTPATDYVDPVSLSYNAVFLQYLPLNAGLLGLDTTRLPLDGKVPFVRVGDVAVVHNTQTAAMVNPVVLSTGYSLGRARIASVKVIDAANVTVAADRYTTNLDAGTITFIASLATYTQPLSVQHRIEDILPVSGVDISGKVSFTRALTHAFPAGTSYVSTALIFGDLQSRAYGQFQQETWTNVWLDAVIGNTIIANYNETASPIVVTNKGSIRERWLLLFISSSEFRVIGESVGEIGTGSINALTAPTNPATLVPYWSLAASGWGTGWAPGNAMRFNTDACGAPIWLARTILQGPATVNSDKFTIAFRGDVNA
jgi:hypothetical protein